MSDAESQSLTDELYALAMTCDIGSALSPEESADETPNIAAKHHPSGYIVGRDTYGNIHYGRFQRRQSNPQ